MQGIDIAGPAPSPVLCRAGMAQALVAHVYGVELTDMRAQTRRMPRAALARQVAMYLSHVVLQLSLSEVGEAFGRGRSTAWHATHHIESLREDSELDRTLDYLETTLRGTIGEAA